MPEGLAGQQNGQAPAFTPPARVPWSELGPEFIEIWSHDDNGKLKGEHFEIAGQNGSGKTYFECTILQQRAKRWDSAEIVIVTKEDDDSIPLLGWPVVDNLKDLKKYKQVIFWPHTELLGHEREAYQEALLYELLTSIWHKDANVVVAFDEIGYVEGLQGPPKHRNRMKRLIAMYWRESRALKISIVAMKQRPVWVLRDQHSESHWKAVFPPADRGDSKRFAELLGEPADWVPVLDSLDRTRHEFVLYNNVLQVHYITWVDEELRPLASQSAQAQERRRRQRQGNANQG